MLKFARLTGVVLFSAVNGCASYSTLAPDQQSKQIQDHIRYLQRYSAGFLKELEQSSEPGMLVLVQNQVNALTVDDPPITALGQSAVDALDGILDEENALIGRERSPSANEFALCIFFYRSEIPVQPSPFNCQELVQHVVLRRSLVKRLALVENKFGIFQESLADFERSTSVLAEKLHGTSTLASDNRRAIKEALLAADEYGRKVSEYRLEVSRFKDHLSEELIEIEQTVSEYRGEVVQHREKIDERLDELNQQLAW